MSTRGEQPRPSIPGRPRRSAARPAPRPPRPTLTLKGTAPAPTPEPIAPAEPALTMLLPPAPAEPVTAPPRIRSKPAFQPWTKTIGPIRAKAFDVARARRLNDLLVAPIGLLPTAEGEVVRPFRIGLGADIAARCKPDVPAAELNRAIRNYARSFLYLFAVAQPGSMRHDADGNPVEPVSEVDRHDAQRGCQTLIARDKQRKPETPTSNAERQTPKDVTAVSPAKQAVDGKAEKRNCNAKKGTFRNHPTRPLLCVRKGIVQRTPADPLANARSAKAASLSLDWYDKNCSDRASYVTARPMLLLWEGSAMDRAMRRLVPMFAYGFDERARDAEAVEGAHRLLARLQAEGLYR